MRVAIGVLLFGALASACGPAAPLSEAPIMTPEPVPVEQVLPETTTTTELSQASRGPQIQLTEPPVGDPIGYVNNLPYAWAYPDPAIEAYYVVGQSYFHLELSWLAAREAFVYRIMGGEDGYCWNARRWTAANLGTPCSEIGQGVHDDVGYGQIIGIHRKPGQPLCDLYGICSIEQHLVDPYTSMKAFIGLILAHGNSPWCYDSSFHSTNGDCATWPGG